MYKYRIYLNQFDFFQFLRDSFQGDLETGQFASADSKILL